MGALKFIYSDAAGKRAIVATEPNVIGALNLKTGLLLLDMVLYFPGISVHTQFLTIFFVCLNLS